MQKALVIIPVFNEEKYLGKILEKIPQKAKGIKIDILVVDDGSTDRTKEIAKKKKCLIISHPLRKGYGTSIREGFDYGLSHGYDYLLKLDGDGQHDPSYISLILKILKRGEVDYVISSRYLRKIDQKTAPPLERRLVNIMITSLINKLTGEEFTDVFCGCFGFQTKILKNIKLKTEGYGLELELILKAFFQGAKILEIPHPLIYHSSCSKFNKVYGKKQNLRFRLENYLKIIISTLKELKLAHFYGKE